MAIATTITPKTTMTELMDDTLIESYIEDQTYDDYPEYDIENDCSYEYECD